MGSGLLDYYRRPYRVYDTFGAVYGRVLISLERDVKPYVIGREKVYERGSTFAGTVWVTSDLDEPIENARVSWRLVRAGADEIVGSNELTVTIPPDAAVGVDRIDLPLPTTLRRDNYRVEMEMAEAGGRTLSRNATEITVSTAATD
jgi:beta-mannosidase